MNDAISEVLFSEKQIAEAVSRTGRQITEDYRGKSPLLVGILKGSVVFMTDLMRAIELDCLIDFMVVHSYGDSTVSSGEVHIDKDIGISAEGRDVIIIEDILDTGITMDRIVRHIKEKNPASVRVCTLLDKQSARKTEVRADYKCFDVENQFVVGYGLDYAQSYRCLPYIGILKEEIYRK